MVTKAVVSYDPLTWNREFGGELPGLANIFQTRNTLPAKMLYLPVA
jgi:hypothetical protein